MRCRFFPSLDRPWPLAGAIVALLTFSACTATPQSGLPAVAGSAASGSIGTISLVFADQQIAHVRLTIDRVIAPGTQLYSNSPDGVPTTLTVMPGHVASTLITTITSGVPQPDDPVTTTPVAYDPTKPRPAPPRPVEAPGSRSIDDKERWGQMSGAPISTPSSRRQY